MTARCVFGQLLLFALSLAAVSWAIGRLAPAPAFIRPKLEYLAEHRDEIDLIFVGSSRLYRGVIPAVFDTELATRGYPVRSFNLAMVAMRPHEANWVLRQILATKPTRLRWVIIELADWTPRIMPSNRFSARAIAWHDSAETLSVLHSSRLAGTSLEERIAAQSDHLLHWGARALRLGQGPEILRSLWVPDEPGPADARWRVGRGFAPFSPAEQRAGLTGHRRRQFVDDPEGYQEEVRGLESSRRGMATHEIFNFSALDGQVELVRRVGAIPVHVVPPGIEATPGLLELESRVPLLMAFNDPERFPDLYRIGHRFDRRHLNAAGARVFSTTLARHFADWLDAR